MIAALLLLLLQNPGLPAAFPDGPEKKLVVKTCLTACHGAENVLKKRRTKDQWDKVMNDMAEKGAKATDADFDTIMEYLARYYGPGASQPQPQQDQHIEEIRTILANRVDEGKKAVGIVVGTIDESGRSVIGHGRLSRSDGRIPDGDTVFEIGSITKVFTSLILADMVEKGEVKLDDPVSKYLPDSVKMPSRNGKQITLRDLSMQVSGLPRMPSNFRPADPQNPYIDYNIAKLYEFLSGYTLTRDPGEKYEYSNLAVGLLGNTLARHAGVDYETLVRTRILAPLKMTRTSITLTDAQKKNFAAGHDPALTEVKNWDMDALAGAGALRSTANDMLTFLAANLELTATPLQAAMRRMLAERRDTGNADLQIAMGWHIWTRYDTGLVWHNGGTGGYRSFIGFDPKTKKGAVVLCNTVFDNDDLGRHLVEANYPVLKVSAPQSK